VKTRRSQAVLRLENMADVSESRHAEQGIA